MLSPYSADQPQNEISLMRRLLLDYRHPGPELYWSTRTGLTILGYQSTENSLGRVVATKTVQVICKGNEIYPQTNVKKEKRFAPYEFHHVTTATTRPMVTQNINPRVRRNTEINTEAVSLHLILRPNTQKTVLYTRRICLVRIDTDRIFFSV